MQYEIYGNTYNIKDYLKAHDCRWDSVKKCWRTQELEKDNLTYKQLKSISEAHDCDFLPLVLSNECNKIQSILKGY